MENHIKVKGIYKYLVCFLVIRCFGAVAENSSSVPVVVKVGVVLDIDQWFGKLAWSCINMSLSDLYASNPTFRTRLHLHLKQPQGDVVGAAAAALHLIKDVQVQAIIGPQHSMQANFIIALGNKSQVPVISFSATSPSLSRSPYFFRATRNDSSQVRAISSMVQAFRWREAVPVYVQNEFGEGIIPSLTDALEEVNARVPYRSPISEFATDEQIAAELYKLMTMQTRVFILHMAPTLGSRVFAKAKEIGMMDEGYVWIMTDSMTNRWSEIEQYDTQTMHGALAVKSYIPKSKELLNFIARWKRHFRHEYPELLDVEMDLVGLRAYDATIALARAVEEVGVTSFSFKNTNVSEKETDLRALGVSQKGQQLVQALSRTQFQGLTGDFYFIDGQVQSSVYEIINVINGNALNGNVYRQVGFWTAENGLVRTLNNPTDNLYSTTRNNLGPIIWPGDSYSIPKGWELPTNGKKLRILVPVVDGFNQFVAVSHDSSTNKTNVEGFSIDVFHAAMEMMPYAVSYVFIPFENPPGVMAGTYTDMVKQVCLGNYDAVVGDTTIEANRSHLVDFTLPYTESGMTMAVPIRFKKDKNGWIFLKPLTSDLWVTTACSFVFIAFVIWVLEHRINPHFRGPPSYQVGTSLSFAFSTLVFAHRERLLSNLSRLVTLVWCFLVLILTQSYTASLASLLTVQQLQPTITDFNQLIRSRATVGFLNGSFVEGMLRDLKSEPLNLRTYNTAEELNDLFSNGSIAAAFDENPNMKIFLAKYCNKYATVELPFKTNGFGFVFPKGSPLVSDVSRAILNVTQSEKIRQIEKAWLKRDVACPDPNSLNSSGSLGLESFWGLFLIAGGAAISALFMFAATFLSEHKDILLEDNSSTPIWTRIRSLATTFDHKDLNSHVFRKTQPQQDIGGSNFAEASPGTDCPQSPSSYSSHNSGTDFSFGSCEEQEQQRTPPSPDIC